MIEYIDSLCITICLGFTPFIGILTDVEIISFLTCFYLDLVRYLMASFGLRVLVDEYLADSF